MRNYILGGLKNFYKANLHCHTTMSDGKLTPEEVKKAYMDEGYSVLAYTDHRKYGLHENLREDNFLPLAGLEVNINKSAIPRVPDRTYHFNLFDRDPGVSKEIRLPKMAYDDTDAINEYIRDMNAAGFLVSYNHPYWSMQDFTEFTKLKGCFAMEIYNHGCEVEGLYGYAPQAYDEMLRNGGGLFCLATDDNHGDRPASAPDCDMFGGFTMIEADELDYGLVMAALESGRFYSSTGPEIYEVYIEDGNLYIKSSPVACIYVVTSTRACHFKLADTGEMITDAVFKLTGGEGYIRVDCKDKQGRRAFGNAYFL